MNITDEIISIKNFGAKGDGITDDTLAFEQAINFIKNSNGKHCILYIPTGVYLLAKGFDIDFDLHIQGQSVEESPLYRSFDRNRKAFGTVIKFKEKYNDITMFKVLNGGKLYFSNILLDGNDGIVTDLYEASYAEKDMIIEFTTTNCNGVDLSNGHFQKGSNNLYVTGFSGIGLKGSLWNRHDNFTANLCGTGFMSGGDDMMFNAIITHCKNGVEIANNHCQITNFRIEWCEEYGINCTNGHFSTIEGFIDRCGYNGIRCSEHTNMNINVSIHRCATIYRGFEYHQLSSPSNKDGCNLFAFGLRNSRVKLFDSKATVRDGNGTALKSPAMGADVRSSDNCQIEIVSYGYEQEKTALTDSISNSLVYANKELETESIKTLDLQNASRFRPPSSWTIPNEGMSAGDIRYEYKTNTLYYYNGTEWKLIATLN